LDRVDARRKDVHYESYQRHVLDRKMLGILATPEGASSPDRQS
jgi:hypothetical protein